ncbi:hypothetical protein CF042_05715 [Klebsiella pneumoniae]|jgi:hypothetical protein|uniref:Uncharacterized protein n=3 Tax=Gammaproteobacteria TaxID=1236 RepID=A0A5J6LJJ9_9GAMM|nr:MULTISPECIES: hypothetical protein [Pseudomonadota]EDV1310787.1 hypothetical protein [Salmonella enterica subsp. enterica]ADP99972.1 conserved hypothetical protein [Marinobacter adhaerens HP15]AGS40906.1 hypothetical protein CYCME_3030 [Cycloclasticus zancles 78-ME]EDW2337542.1 hypothetical protein [Salmonella enterica subsp. enterica]EFI4080045.1 hypothetical protein [Escherichia coli]
MSDWDYLHDMRAEGYGEEAISEAAATGVAPWHYSHINENELRQDIDLLKMSLKNRDITRKEFAAQMKECRKRKKELKTYINGGV